jgi:hypothetical protein
MSHPLACDFLELKIENYIFISVLHDIGNCAIAVNVEVQIEVAWFQDGSC